MIILPRQHSTHAPDETLPISCLLYHRAIRNVQEFFHLYKYLSALELFRVWREDWLPVSVSGCQPRNLWWPTAPSSFEDWETMHLSGVVGGASLGPALLAYAGRSTLPKAATLVLWHAAGAGLLVALAASSHLARHTTGMLGKVGGCNGEIQTQP